MALSSLSSTVKLVTGYEIPVVGFGVSGYGPILMMCWLISGSEIRSTKRMLLSELLNNNGLT